LSLEDRVRERYGGVEAFMEWAERREELVRRAVRELKEGGSADITGVFRHDGFNIVSGRLELDWAKVKVTVEKYRAPLEAVKTFKTPEELRAEHGAFPEPFTLHYKGITVNGYSYVKAEGGNISVYDKVEIVLDRPRMEVIEKLAKDDLDIELHYILLTAINLSEAVLSFKAEAVKKITELIRALKTMIKTSADVIGVEPETLKQL